MSATLQATGSTLMVIGSNVQLTAVTPSSPTVYVVEVDPQFLATGEALTLTILSAAKVGGALTAADTQTYTGTGSAILQHLWSSTIIVGSSATVQLKQGNGTARTLDWSMYAMT